MANAAADATACVLDDTGRPLPGAQVRIVGTDRIVVTDADGRFNVPSVSGGDVRVQVSYVGFQTATFVISSKDGHASGHTLRMTPDVTALDQLVVTATRTPKALKDAPVVTRLITEADIKRADATNVQDLLTEELPGLEFSYAMSQETALNMNGFGGSAVLFLVDGERLAGETMDNVDYNRLNLDNVGRIEVVKGAASALYGANAVGGVVNIISREGNEPWTASVNSRYSAMGDAWRHGANFSLNQGRWNSQTNLQRTTQKHVQLTDMFDLQSTVREIFGGETFNLKERLVYRLSDKVRLIGRGSYFSRVSDRVAYDDHYRDYSGGLKAQVHFDDRNSLELTYGYDQYDKLRFVDGERTHEHDYSNRQHTAHALYSHVFDAGTLTVGADYLNDYLSTYQFTDNGSRTQYSVDAYAQYDYSPLKWLNVVGSLRHDYFSASDAMSVTGRVALMTKWDGFSIRANYAGGFRAPTLKEMYMNFDMVGLQMIYGNPDLKAEKSHNFNLAFEHTGKVGGGWMKGKYSLTLMGYYNKYRNRITTTDYDNGVVEEKGIIYVNESGVSVTGVDFSAQYRSDTGLGVRVNYNGMHTSGNTVDVEYSQPRPHTATWRIDYDSQLSSVYGFNAALTGRYLSAPKASAVTTGGAYQIWKFSLQQRVYDFLSVNFNVDNLFGYRPKTYYYNSAMTTGRTWAVGLSVDIDRLVKFF